MIVGHLHDPDSAGHGQHPAGATVTVSDIRRGLDSSVWRVENAEELDRTEGEVVLRDIVVRASRRP